MDSFVDELPKAELHLHLVGSASVPTVLELARRHTGGSGVPPGSGVPRTEPELRAFFEFRDFPHFADVYAAVSGLVREPADVAELVLGAARDLAGQNVRYAELTVTPYTFTAYGMPVADLTEALDIAARSARRDHGVRIAYIFDIAGELGGGLRNSPVRMPSRQLEHGRHGCGTNQVKVKFYLRQPVDERVDGLHGLDASNTQPRYGRYLTQECQE